MKMYMKVMQLVARGLMIVMQLRR